MKLFAEGKIPVSIKCDPFLIAQAREVLGKCTREGTAERSTSLPVILAERTPSAVPEPTGTNLNTNVVGASASIQLFY